MYELYGLYSVYTLNGLYGSCMLRGSWVSYLICGYMWVIWVIYVKWVICVVLVMWVFWVILVIWVIWVMWAFFGYPWLAVQYVGIHPGVWKSGLYPGEQFGVHVIPSQVTDIASDVLKVLTSMTIDTAVENIFTHALCYIL